MELSLILCTVDRTTELIRFFESLTKQNFSDLEVILVDQNDDDRLVPIVSDIRGILKIRHVRSARGLSRARNVGLKLATGNIIAFPDDDCWYPDELLRHVMSKFASSSKFDGITGRFTNDAGESEGRWLRHDQQLNAYNVWRGAISFSIFLKRSVIERVGFFDETLGVGAGTSWGAAEETDFLLRAIKSGFCLHYFTDVILKHPVKAALLDAKARRRHESYEEGIGRVIRLNNYPAWYFPGTCIRTFIGCFIAILSGRVDSAIFKACAIRGRVRGWSAKRDRCIT